MAGQQEKFPSGEACSCQPHLGPPTGDVAESHSLQVLKILATLTLGLSPRSS